MAYDPNIPEEELKNRVARDVFGALDCVRVFGKVDFCVSPHVEGAAVSRPPEQHGGLESATPCDPFGMTGRAGKSAPDYRALVGDLRAAMKTLAATIAPKVHEHGFLR